MQVLPEPIQKLTAAFERNGTEGLNVACTQELHFTAEEWRAMSEADKRAVYQYIKSLPGDPGQPSPAPSARPKPVMPDSVLIEAPESRRQEG